MEAAALAGVPRFAFISALIPAIPGIGEWQSDNIRVWAEIKCIFGKISVSPSLLDKGLFNKPLFMLKGHRSAHKDACTENTKEEKFVAA